MSSGSESARQAYQIGNVAHLEWRPVCLRPGLATECRRQQATTEDKLARADGLPKSLQCSDRLNHMVNAFRNQFVVTYAHISLSSETVKHLPQIFYL